MGHCAGMIQRGPWGPGLLSQRRTPRRVRPGLGLVAAAKEEQTEEHEIRLAPPAAPRGQRTDRYRKVTRSVLQWHAATFGQPERTQRRQEEECREHDEQCQRSAEITDERHREGRENRRDSSDTGSPARAGRS